LQNCNGFLKFIFLLIDFFLILKSCAILQIPQKTEKKPIQLALINVFALQNILQTVAKIAIKKIRNFLLILCI
jgi:hypothetical protein